MTEDIEKIDPLDYLYSFSDNEIVDIVVHPKEWTEKEIELAKKISAQRGLSESIRNNEIKIKKQKNTGSFFPALKFAYYFICAILILAGIAFIQTGGIALISVSFLLFSMPTVINSLIQKKKNTKGKKKSEVLISILKYGYHLICWLTLVIGVLGIMADEDKRIGICIISFSVLLFIIPIIIKWLKRKK
jgi:hypothetical protein